MVVDSNTKNDSQILFESDSINMEIYTSTERYFWNILQAAKIENKEQIAEQTMRLSIIAYFKPRPNKTSPFLYKFMINGTAIACNTDTYLIVLVNSAVNHFELRNAIRQTWGSVAKGNAWPNQHLTEQIKLGFIVGLSTEVGINTKLQAESDMHCDVIQGDFMDDYRNMTIKSLLAMKWIFTHCPSAKYFLKADDDVFIHMPGVFDVLKMSETRVKRFITGAVLGR